ncbi:hypothetical protein DCAR_0208010 [Daucus carota subsp. sativus]|uniref:Uncharacterized protein n=1 Tax=Daucus carota subsp. sativus TaxID=79200 RepID=A0AAF0WF51_DAUCS|nr:hypothetical protein DCAR_0208010 [Daucus carota subsp. sativus]
MERGKSVFVFDLNESPPPAASPVEKNGGGGGGRVCGSCRKAAGEVEGEMQACVRCGKCFHMKCMGTKHKVDDWKCFGCLFAGNGAGGSGSGSSSNAEKAGAGGAERLLDMNAPPPPDEEEVQFLGVSYGGASLGIHRQPEQYDQRMQASCDTSVPHHTVSGHSFNTPASYLQSLHMGSGIYFQKPSQCATDDAMSMYEAPLHHRLNHNRMPGNADTRFKPDAILETSHHERPVLTPASDRAKEIYLQDLKDFVLGKKGVLGDGWYVEFYYYPVRCKTLPIYFAPGGRRFESVSAVAIYLGLIPNAHALEADSRGDGVTLSEKGHKGKESKVFLGVDTSRAAKNIQQEFLGEKSSLSAEIINADVRRLTQSIRSPQLDKIKIDDPEHQKFCEGFPVQFEDLYIIHAGKVDQRNSYHDSGHIWPVGYKSCWHDQITGSVFVSDVLEGGDDGPLFKVQRYPCTEQYIPSCSTVVCKRSESDNSISEANDEEYTSMQMLLTEHAPPCLDDNLLSGTPAFKDPSCQEVNRKTSSDWHPQRSRNETSYCAGPGDCIGKFMVEGKSSSSVWEKVASTFLTACREAFKKTGVLQFWCGHNVDRSYFKAIKNADLLSKFSRSCGPVNIPHSFESIEDFNASSEMLKKWLQQDRFGLDLEFVQELLEQLPEVRNCPGYIFLDKRSPKSILQTVGTGFLVAKRMSDAPVKKKSTTFIKTCEARKKKAIEDFEIRARRPLGKPFCSKLPVKLIGDVLQVWEFSRRFSDVLGLEKPFSLQELECELINPWLDNPPPPQKLANGTQDVVDANSYRNHMINNHAKSSCSNYFPVVAEKFLACMGTHGNCTGVILTNAHTSLLSTLISELLIKVAPHVDPNFDTGEFKSKRGKKKDSENSNIAKKAKIDALPINDLTWPELARRYVLAVLSMEGNLDCTEIISRESGRVFHCLQGDGGPLCGSLTGVAAMEADALLLAEASKKVYGSLKSKDDVLSIDQNESDASDALKIVADNDSEVPDWARVLEPVRKLPTNVGARIRRLVHEALEKNPPEWAKKILLYSISKEVYKGNASGPTKRAVVSVLDDSRCEKPQQKPEKKEIGKTPAIALSDLLMKQCRLVLRRVTAADEKKVFCNLLGRTFLISNDNDDKGCLGYPAMVSRPLDFRTIDLRLAAGSYNGSHEAFFEDVQEVWYNIRMAYGSQPKLTGLAETLFRKFEEMYEEEVLVLVNKTRKHANPDSLNEKAKELEDMVAHATETSLPKAPWDEEVCKVCGMDRDDDSVLLCDSCDSEYHTYCLNPPLVRIPEGNWYCPSCLAGKPTYHGASYGTRVSSLCRRRYQKDLTNRYLDELADLANAMEVKEYWDLNLEQRIFLIKLLTDEILNSATMRDHIDRSVSGSSDLQQKIRATTSEWNALNSCADNGSMLSEAPDGEPSNFPENMISNLQKSIATLESELLKVQVRKEPLGRDSDGRLYWVFSSIGTSLQQADLQDHRTTTQSSSNMRNTVLVVGSPSSSREISFSNIFPAEEIKHAPVSSDWSCYQSDSEIQELIGWLRETVATEKELKDSISHWHQIKLHDTNVAKSHIQHEMQPTPLNSTINGKPLDTDSPVTNAWTALEKKFGPCLKIQATDNSNEQGYKAETSFQGRICRCKCLELLWASKQHCFSCHQTFSTREDLDKHNDGACSMSLGFRESNMDSSKRKRMRSEPLLENSSDLRTVKAFKGEKQKAASCFDEKTHPECPFTLEEIITKFVIKDPVKEVVKDIGLISSAGQVSFVSQRAAYPDHPVLSLVPIDPSDSSSKLANQKIVSKRRVNTVIGTKTGHSSSTFRWPDKGMEQEPVKGGRPNSKCMSERDPLSATKNMLRGGKWAVYRESSERPIRGRLCGILCRLKSYLLDMDAALPEEALRPSRTNFEKRRLWRGFVKSAESIYEMNQAITVLEDAIKTAYLRKDWWYWSSPSAMAKICTISALALRIYALDAAIIYEKNIPTEDLGDVCRLGKVSPSTSVLPKSDKSDSPDLPKLRSRSNKRRKA